MSEAQENLHNWVCSCGQENEGKFCMACGKLRPQTVKPMNQEAQTESDNSWVCSCGQRNEGKFCTVCGQPRRQDTAVLQVMHPEQGIQSKSVGLKKETALETATPQATAERKSVRVNSRVLVALGVVVVLILGVVGGILGYFYFGVEPTSAKVAFTGKTREQGSMSALDNWANAKTDLSLEGIDLGDNLERVLELLGTEGESTRRGGGQNYSFADVDVLLKNSKVTELTSKSEEARTKRGIHQGSVEDEVLQAYGQEYQKVSLGKGIAYDYALKLEDGSTGTLRFVIENGKVKNVRLWSNAVANTSPVNGTPVSIAMKAMQNYHQAITNRQYAQAYGMLTNRAQNQMGVYANYVKGFANTIYSNVTDMKVISASPYRVVLSYKLIAKDRAEGGKVLVQTFAGTATLVLQGNAWLIDEKASKQTGSRLE